MPTRRQTLDRIRDAVAPLYDAREARSIALAAVSELAGIPVAALLTDPEAPLDIAALDTAVERLAAGCPLQYVTGGAEFFGRRFAVREGVLIPRPETEELTDWILRHERSRVPEADSGPERPTAILDVGTGSGCIAATLALELPCAKLYAADRSETALATAAENCRALGARVTLRRADALADLAEVFPERFDIVVSNPPYVPASDRASMHANVREYEPAEALFVPDNDPLVFYRAIARAGRRMLRPGGRLYFEIYAPYADAVRRLLDDEGYTRTRIRTDLSGKPRMTCSRNG